MKKLIFFSIAIFLFSACNVSYEKENLVRKYLDAHNAHKTHRALKLFDENASFHVGTTHIKNGIEEIRSIEEWDSVLQSTYRYEIVKINEDTVFCDIQENNLWLDALDIEPVKYQYAQFIIRNNKIQQVSVKLTREDQKRLSEELNHLMKWALQTNPDMIAEISKDGEFVYNRQSAETWLKLVRKYERK